MSDYLNHSSAVDQVVPEDEIELLSAVNDDFEGVMVELKKPMASEVFHSRLRASMSVWRQQGKRGVWLKLPIELTNLVETAVKEGFWYHHAEPSYLMLIYWIPDTACILPGNASHRVGVGAVVVTEKREILVVQEKCGPLRGQGVWKIPTGVMEEGEDICRAVTREVKEETGIDAEFVEILAFRQSHKAFFGKSDLFFLCFLRPLTFEIEKQESEIDAAEWMPLEEFQARTSAQKQGLGRYICDLCLAKIDKGYAGFTPEPMSSTFSKKLSYLYCNKSGRI